MSKLTLYAVMMAASADPLGDALPTLPVAGLSLIRALDLVAVVGPSPREPWLGLGRARLAGQMVDFQRALEALMPFGPVVPAAFGMTFENHLAPIAFLVAHAATLRHALAEQGGKHQYQVTVSWDPQLMLQRLRGSDRLAALRDFDPASNPKGFAAALAGIMESYRAELGRAQTAILADVSDDILEMPPSDANGLVNATVLIKPDTLPSLEAVLQAIDATAPEALRIRLIGPLPPCAFASLRLERPDPLKIAAARRELGAAAKVPADALKRAYRDRIRSVHPDLVRGHEAESASAREAYDLLRRLGDAEAALAAQGLSVSASVPLVRLQRADAADIAA